LSSWIENYNQNYVENVGSLAAEITATQPHYEVVNVEKANRSSLMKG